METTIWILKGVITLVFTFTGINKIFLPKTKLLDKGMKGLQDIDEKQIKVVVFLRICTLRFFIMMEKLYMPDHLK